MHSWLKWTGTAVLLAGLVGCTKETDDGTETGTAQLSINATPKSIDNKGQSTTLRVFATDAASKSGTGEVTIATTAGLLGNSTKSQTLTLDGTGSASTTFTCAVTQDPACVGSVMLQASWSTVSATATVTVTTSGTDGGTPTDGGTTPTDGGTTPTDGGTTDGGSGPPVKEPGKPANIVYDTPATPPQLGIRSVGLQTSTLVAFTVLDYSGSPVPNVPVLFSVVGPAGVSLVPDSAQTNDAGKAFTVLQSGDEVGVATVSGQITTSTGGKLAASSKSIPIIGARVSDRGLVVECTQINLSANMSETPPRKDISTACSAYLSDRFTNRITQPVTVTWYSEAGAISSPTTSDDSSRATATFTTAGKWPPVPVDPVGVEPSYLADGKIYNPRDMLVTVIAVTAGEEEFYDGSGVSNGTKNGQWDPGEWFVDTPEPFVDANDNQVYDPGEAFIDTERLDCTTGKTEPKNGKWDGPNGCWDGNTMLWRPTHILYSGFNSVDQARITFNPKSGTVTVPKKLDYDVEFSLTDAYLNLLSPDDDTYAAQLVSKLGSATAINPASSNIRTYGFQVIHERAETVVDATQPRGYRDVGLCDPGKAAPAGASTNPKLARCVWQYRFGLFGTFLDRATLQLSSGTDTPGTFPVTASAIFSNKYGSLVAPYKFNF